MIRPLLLAIATSIAFTSLAQRHEILSPDIASLQVMAGTNWRSPAITTLDGEPINISFDELSHDYHRYTYKIQHCEADWTPSDELFDSDYISGFYDDNVIDSSQESVDTYQLYTHYSLSIPNSQCRLTMSGNYKLTVYDEDVGAGQAQPVLTACFMISEETATLALDFTTRTDLDINGRHQQLTMQADYSALRVTAPDRELFTVITQNQRWDNAVINPRPQYKMRNTMRWDHCRELIFSAGNEYHKFETLSPDHPSMGIADVGWDSELDEWHAYVTPDTPAKNYIYDVDANGSFLIRNSDDDENDLKSDYILTHFELQAPRQEGTVYLSGAWTNQQLLPQYEMRWNHDTEAYEAVVKLKQGYYSYHYLVLHADGTISRLKGDGDFFQTENSYQALLYFRGATDRATRLVAYSSIRTRDD